MDVRVISIGALAAHSLWGEREPVRAGHATSTLIRSGERAILVDPGLPGPAIVSRLLERAGIGPEAITDVFLTRMHIETRRGIEAFERADWWLSEPEREHVGTRMALSLKNAADGDDEELIAQLEREVAIIQRCKAAPDRLAPGVDLFPLHGVTPGLTGLLIVEPTRTVLVCGDAVATVEHLEAGQVLSGAADTDQARESFAEAVEIADVLVLGRDNAVSNPTKRGF
jgi:glyoxylase-like metal-dependent hydrolase (beta-lactamase superfamily II)